MKRPLAGNMLLALVALLLSCSVVCNGKDTILGVSESELHLYERKGPNWTCLDDSAVIPYEAINDDYCDCADGSDEPGTSACPNGRFNCKNVGHVSAYISSSRVNDGVCDPECCDGSDEYDGKVECPNICKEVGMEYRKSLRELTALRAQGAKKKHEYIEYGKKLKMERINNLEDLKVELDAAKIKSSSNINAIAYNIITAALKKIKQLENSSDSSKNKECFRKIKNYKERIKRLKDRIDAQQEDIETLLKVLKDMKDGHNPNYHDMAVKTAITAYDEFLEEYNRESNEDVDYVMDDYKGEEEEDMNVDNTYEVPQIQDPEPSLWDQYVELWRIFANGVLEFFGMEQYSISQASSYRSSARVEPGASRDIQAATNARNSAEEEKKNLESKIEDINNKLSKDYGSQEEFAKLDGECFERNTGEYTYSVCMFGAATQKSNNDHTSTHLGNFEKWIGAESKDDPAYYTKQIYENGIRCWNGPERSVKLQLECGVENKIISVSEPEKCEYYIKMITPAVCPDNVHIENNGGHEEL
ncbi:18603_t:CDS:10 [Acaulospora morrowiae]|uniref:Glucosidase 2 subunit beta n=1 Tax=Acaulospora morrowiae TaxID=94023 RepID=A0A9N8ZPK8_9GLOM|nr:18603_t:CDS:10 [Acaulospora morrowiae]